MGIDSMPEPPIFKLDQDCCDVIFRYLNLGDQFSLAQTCQQLQTFFCCYIGYKQNPIKFTNMDKYKVEEILNFLLNNGVKSKSMEAVGGTFQENRNKFLYILARKFPNLMRLKLHGFDVFCSRAMEKLMGSLTNLTELSLVRCDLNDAHCLYLQFCTKLEKLDLSENYLITAKYLDKFPNLIHLNLNYCRHVKPVYFVMLCKVSKLRQLHIAYCDCLNEISFRGMVVHLTELDTLTISSTYRCKKLKLITRLPKLKCLEIHGFRHIRPGFYRQLVDRKSASLEKLTLIGSQVDVKAKAFEEIFYFSNMKHLNIKFLPFFNDNWLEKISEIDSLEYLGCVACRNITSEGLISAIVQLRNLVEIDVSYCTNLDTVLVEVLLKKLMLQKNRKKLTMHVGVTKLTKSMVEDKRLKMFSHVLELTSKATAPVEHMRYASFRKPSYI